MAPVLVVGGAGYIGSHVCKALKKANYQPVVFDNFSHGHKWATRYGPCLTGDLHHVETLDKAFSLYSPCAVIHLASLINARESTQFPEKYYHNNVIGTLHLLNAMVRHDVKLLIFSSTAAIYGAPSYLPLDEEHPKTPLNPYGKSKWMVEEILADFFQAYQLRSITLRYFNAAGADPEGEVGEAHSPETHLIPLAILTALGQQPTFRLNGTDHPTADGTAIRDYIHVSDLALAHVRSLEILREGSDSLTLNLGTGQGYSVFEVLKAIERKSSCSLPITLAERSLADPPILVADARRAKSLLDWQPLYSDLDTIIDSAWNWHKKKII